MSDMSELDYVVRPEVYFAVVMLWPEKQDFARAWESIEFEALERSLRMTENSGHRVSMDAELLARMLDEAQSRDALNRQLNFDLSYSHGRIAGQIVNFVLAANSYPETRQYASITCAARIIHKCNFDSTGFGIENIQQKIWPKFKPVANLWAALQIFGLDKVNFCHRRRLPTDADLGTVMGYAIEILELGTQCTLFHTRNTLLDRSTNVLGKYKPMHKDLAYAPLPEELLKLAVAEPR